MTHEIKYNVNKNRWQRRKINKCEDVRLGMGLKHASYKDIYLFCWWKANLALSLFAAN